MKRWGRFSIFTAIAFILFCNLASGLSIQGVVTDTSAKPVTNALVVVTSESDLSQRYTASTNSSGKFEINFDETGVSEQKPIPFQLLQNWPNPFNPATNIGYTLEKGNTIQLEIYNILGQKVRVLDSGFKSPGVHILIWNGRDDTGKSCAAGVYLYRLLAGNNVAMKKMLLLDGAVSASGTGGFSGSSKTAEVHRYASTLYTIEVTGLGIRAYREEHLILSGNQTKNISVERLPDNQQDVSITQTGSTGATTVLAGATGVTMQLVTEKGLSSSTLSGVQATVQKVSQGSFVLLEQLTGKVIPTVQFIGNESSSQVTVPMVSADTTNVNWSAINLPNGFSLPKESIMDTLAISQVVWYLKEHPDIHTVMLYNTQSWDKKNQDIPVILYLTNSGRILHLQFPSATFKSTFEPVTITVIFVAVVLGLVVYKIWEECMPNGVSLMETMVTDDLKNTMSWCHGGHNLYTNWINIAIQSKLYGY
ncbi:MAG: T9SS type A sorting domain-containing protein [Candidatus Latescibacter sp.]|nr:T9SS type A sorting domain-containing protein [Candidatus Latescibacter sp.]